ncbi:very short patch repair endonuclease [Paremcibacter congregatus]|uniref:very short patch repair endonuclease n=1 Tax=Paremcibacter congregatus TaxID=2043170 RepID=UPI003A8CADCE
MDRSKVMSRVRSKNTKPELLVRHLLFSHGYRYRIHCKDLPGCPDIIFSARKKVIFVNGCFWHGHDCKRGARIPKTNMEYWLKKIQGNVKRDKINIKDLENLGWSVCRVWECELKDFEKVRVRLISFLGDMRFNAN